MRVCLVVLVAMATALFSGCGSSSKSSSTNTNASVATATTGATGTGTKGAKGPPAGHFKRGGAGARVSSPAFKAALAKFATCLRQNGVNISTPNTSSNGPIFSTKGINTSSAQFRTAERKCSATLRSALKASAGAPGGGGAGGKVSGSAGATTGSAGQAKASPASKPALKVPPKVARTFQQFTACMREHGITNFPEPEGASFNLSHTHVDSGSAQYKAAQTKCNHILQAIA